VLDTTYDSDRLSIGNLRSYIMTRWEDDKMTTTKLIPS
jgi:hypothetical protein